MNISVYTEGDAKNQRPAPRNGLWKCLRKRAAQVSTVVRDIWMPCFHPTTNSARSALQQQHSVLVLEHNN